LAPTWVLGLAIVFLLLQIFAIGLVISSHMNVLLLINQRFSV
jgi:hypothetical protein